MITEEQLAEFGEGSIHKFADLAGHGHPGRLLIPEVG
jgi:hypothetical protein